MNDELKKLSKKAVLNKIEDGVYVYAKVAALSSINEHFKYE